jgi:hypothetical protein
VLIRKSFLEAGQTFPLLICWLYANGQNTLPIVNSAHPPGLKTYRGLLLKLIYISNRLSLLELFCLFQTVELSYFSYFQTGEAAAAELLQEVQHSATCEIRLEFYHRLLLLVKLKLG